MSKSTILKSGEQKLKRPTLFEENEFLRKTITSLQDQNSLLVEQNHDLDKQNSIQKEKLSNFGLRDLLKNIGFLGIGLAIGDLFSQQYLRSALVSIFSFFVLAMFSIYDNFLKKKEYNKEKVS